MKKLWLFCCLALVFPTAAGAGEKIDPTDFICAELVAMPTTTGEPSLFEALQVDGYLSAQQNATIADPTLIAPLLEQVYVACQAAPTETVLAFWKKGREGLTVSEESPWRADKTTCGDYAANEDDGSGFVIWLDGYNRGKSGTGASILESDSTFNDFMAKCKAQPKDLMLDVMRSSAKGGK
ncbi:MAG: hypothetical protein LBR31_03815 [Desulfovibrio sp.]|jgi:hypothetical protein|nr:hypothetical protein [Desulfovibrio sp.]